MAKLDGIFRMKFVYPMTENLINTTKKNALRENNL